ncbi:MAG: homocysteine S-methyltransferase family protein [Chloroflexi bacterium]|nr:homocysteine S-methyltransferase family protein [Chloroflexota bacterium]MCL5075018.1 homocysteine S-methyltransferase family protein [Chloroflexota bacterium]
MSNRFNEALEKKRVLICDGAMGTMLMSSGAHYDLCPEELNLTTPEVVRAVHRAYVEAGADIIETNSFGGNSVKLAVARMFEKRREVNLAAACLAKEVAGDSVLVAGSIGPLGKFLQPLGQVSYGQAVEAFREQAEALMKGGVDLFIIETMADLKEIKAAYQAVTEGTGLPAICTMTFDTGHRTMMGVSPAQAAQELCALGVPVIGANCGRGPEEFEAVLQEMKEACPQAILAVQPNAGLPKLVGDKVIYDASPEEMAEYARRFVALGVRVIGACCGSTPEHIRAIIEAVRASS